MKKLLFSLLAIGICSFSFAQDKKADELGKFDSEVVDLGKIKQGSPTTATFKVKNIGTDALLIEQANPTCGCTISSFTKEPIAVGKYGEINATYNAAAQGSFEKHLTVKFAGSSEVKSITIKGQVLTAEEFGKLNGEAPAIVTPTAEVTPAATPEAKEIKEVAAPKKAAVKKPAAPKPKAAPATAPAAKKAGSK